MTKTVKQEQDFTDIMDKAQEKSKDLDLDFLKHLPVELTEPQPIPFPYGSGKAKPYGWFSS